jgi:PAS domain S-box-containing protein
MADGSHRRNALVEAEASRNFFIQFDWAATPIGPITQWPSTLRTAFDIALGSPSPIVILWGRDGHLIYNDGYAAICGARHPEILGQKALDAWPEVAALNRRVLDTCLAGKTLSLRDEQLVLYRNGYPEDVWLDVDYSPLPGPDGRIEGVFAIVNEVTMRVLSDWRRREAENQLALAIEGADLGTWDYDLKNNTYFWSDRLREMFGFPSGETMSQEKFRDRIHPEDRQRQAEAFAAVIDSQRRVRYDLEFRVIGAQDGRIRWLATLGRAHFNDQGRALRVAGTAVDITVRKNAERRQLSLVELGDHLRAADTTAGIARIAAELAGRVLQCSRAGYAMIENNSAFVEADWTNGEAVSLVGPRLFGTLGDPFATPLRQGRHLVIDDVVTHATTMHNPAPFLAIKMCAVINIPLLENGQIAAIFYVHHAAPRHWDESEVELVRDIADRTWEAFIRARSNQRLRKLTQTLAQEVASRTAQRDRMWRLSSDVMLVAGFDGGIETVNPAWQSLFGWTEDDVIGGNLFDLTHAQDRDAVAQVFERLKAGPQPPAKFESRHRHRDGSYFWLSWRAVPGENAIHAVGRDITQEREQAFALQVAEAALRQAQKMEAVGQLTGGIAHDFNNLLQGISGSLELLEKRLDQGRFDEVEKYTAAARASANRAIALTHRLLAFSRRQPLDPQPVQANPLVTSMQDLLRQTMGETIEIIQHLQPDLWPALCDPNQLESAILNLAINARDAMPDGGKLIIETRNIELDAAATRHRQGLKPGPYICLSVSDTGTGMPASVIEQAFEPFYTTKPLGQGTGLGLSMIYGFIQQSGGDVRIYSELGRGTTIKLYLPRCTADTAYEERTAIASAALDPYAHPRPANILVVEDEETVRALVLEVLNELNLPAIAASTGPEGLKILQSKQPVDLLITDIGLPGLNGRQIADAARLLRPELKILFMTGYAETAAMANGALEPGMAMITKPFAIGTLAARIRTILDETV